MCYESRIYAVHRVEIETKRGKPYVIGCAFASFEVLALPYSTDDHGFSELFTMPIDYDLPDEGDGGARLDCYGMHCTAADCETVRAWTREHARKFDTRMQAFAAWLEVFDESEYSESVQLVHFGH